MMEAGSSTTTSKENGKAKGKGKSSRCSSSSSTRSWGWTNERHLRFLNTIEASFVQAMFENINYNSNINNNNNNKKKKNNICDDLRLDRHIPDSYESTQDLPMAKLRRPRTFSTSPSPDVEDRSVRVSKKNKGQLSNDQVVPQVEIRRRDNENDKDGKNVD